MTTREGRGKDLPLVRREEWTVERGATQAWLRRMRIQEKTERENTKSYREGGKEKKKKKRRTSQMEKMAREMGRLKRKKKKKKLGVDEDLKMKKKARNKWNKLSGALLVSGCDVRGPLLQAKDLFQPLCSLLLFSRSSSSETAAPEEFP